MHLHRKRGWGGAKVQCPTLRIQTPQRFFTKFKVHHAVIDIFNMKFFHWLLHITGLNHGIIESWDDGDRIMVGFRCTCGELMGVHEVDLGVDDDKSL